MKYINKLRNLNWKLKLLICITVTIIGFGLTRLLLNNIEYKVKNYDYKKIYSVNGVVTKAYFKKSYIPSWISFDYNNSAYIDVELETGKVVTVKLGSKLSYSKGENITLYTNDSNYAFTKRKVAIDSQNTITNQLLISCNWIFVIMVWSILFKWRGLIISLFMLIFYSL